MSGLVVDTSVVVKWFLSEVHSEDARRLLNGDYDMFSPDLLLPEFGNVMWKRVRSGEMSGEEAKTAVEGLLLVPITICPSNILIVPALEIAQKAGRTVYDSLYLALAMTEKSPLVTADSRLFNSLRNTPLASQLLWVEEIT